MRIPQQDPEKQNFLFSTVLMYCILRLSDFKQKAPFKVCAQNLSNPGVAKKTFHPTAEIE